MTVARDLSQSGLFEYDDYREDTTLTADVCIIGSGCGGATLARFLAEAGLAVIVIEQGPHVPAAKMDQDEMNMTARLYGERGMATDTTFSCNLMYGHNIGGASVHYWADSYRTPPEKLQHWQNHYGLRGHTEADLASHFDTLERTLHVHPAPDSAFNTLNHRFREATTRLGWHGHRVPNARRNCVNSGHCMQGCLYDAKQSQMITHLPMAIARGARVFADLRAEQFAFEGRRMTTLHALAIDRARAQPSGVRFTIRARAFAVAAGGFNSSALLLRQALPQALPALGRHFSMNPSSMVHALFDEDIVMWRGIPAAWGCDEFRLARHDETGTYREGGYLLMPNQLHPGMLGATLPGPAADRVRWMSQLRRVGGAICWMDDIESELGDIRLVDGRRQVRYDYGPRTRAVLADSVHKMCEVLFTAGARELLVAGHQGLRLRSRADLPVLETLQITAGGLYLSAPHPGGGCRMGENPADSVVNSDHRVHGTDNLYVSDSSVFPSSCSLDPSLTIMAFSAVAAGRIRESLQG